MLEQILDLAKQHFIEDNYIEYLRKELLSIKEYLKSDADALERLEEGKISDGFDNCPYAKITNEDESNFGSSGLIPEEIEFEIIDKGWTTLEVLVNYIANHEENHEEKFKLLQDYLTT